MWYLRYHYNSALGMLIFFTSCISRTQVEMQLDW